MESYTKQYNLIILKTNALYSDRIDTYSVMHLVHTW